MTITEGSKNILNYLLKRAISMGDLNYLFAIDHKSLTKELALESENYCTVCFQYLVQFRYVQWCTDNDSNLYSITAEGIEFLETN